jgi:leader peptidase (prepilin peptidase) / N-methyltransferase
MCVLLYVIFGVQLGSFLNVVVYRLPLQMQQMWRRECAAFLGQVIPDEPDIKLGSARSECPKCGQRLRAVDLVPVLSYLWLRGRCAHCGTHISWRYPLVELLVAMAWGWCAFQWGETWSALAWACFASALITLALIDYDTMLLPDTLTQPLLWAGLLLSYRGVTGLTLEVSLLGAVAGYMSLWLMAKTFAWVTGREGMGEGDFKLLAAIGAWLGWEPLPVIALMASVLAVLVAIGIKVFKTGNANREMPFGPNLILCSMFVVFVQK